MRLTGKQKLVVGHVMTIHGGEWSWANEYSITTSFSPPPLELLASAECHHLHHSLPGVRSPVFVLPLEDASTPATTCRFSAS